MTTDGRRQTRYAACGLDVRERDVVLHAFGERLRAQRGAERLTQEDLAVRCFMRRAQISRIECGDRAPNLSDLLITEPFPSESGGEFEHKWKCPATGSWYHLWVWGRQLGTHGKTQWSEAGWEERTGSCTHQGPVDMSPVGQGGEPS
jgi:DNA-binding XRE family transcriptional regulator